MNSTAHQGGKDYGGLGSAIAQPLTHLGVAATLTARQEMAVYVDAPIYKYRRMVMCHMVADTRAELLGMADKIGVQRKWLQSGNTYREHFDICKTKRALAIQHGAQEVTSKQLVKIIQGKRGRK